MEMGNNLKTIVYLTVNTVNNKIYIGVHDTDTPYEFDGYLGNGINIYKERMIKHPSTPFQYAVKKYGYNAFRRVTLFVYSSREEALKKEAEIVNKEFLLRTDVYNATTGGGNPPNICRAVYQYDLSGNFIREYKSVSQAKKITRAGNITSAILYKHISGKSFWTDYKVDHLDIAQFNNTTQVKSVYIYKSDGTFYKEFPSLAEARTFLGVSLGALQRAISATTKAGSYYCSLTYMDSFVKCISKKHTGVIHQYSLEGDFIKTWENATAAAKSFGKKTGSQITKSIKIKKSCFGFQWSWEHVDKMPNISSKVNNTKKVGQFTTNGKLVKVYDTVRECRKEFPNVSRVLRGLANHCKGYTFKYIS